MRGQKKGSLVKNSSEFTNIFKTGALRFRSCCMNSLLCLFLKDAPWIAQVENERGCKSHIWPT
jgi:hypothetical protein